MARLLHCDTRLRAGKKSKGLLTTAGREEEREDGCAKLCLRRGLAACFVAILFHYKRKRCKVDEKGNARDRIGLEAVCTDDRRHARIRKAHPRSKLRQIGITPKVNA